MKLLFCGATDEYIIAKECIKSEFLDFEIVVCENNEELLILLKNFSFNIAMVTFSGADGMETVITLRKQRPELPVVWFSDDSGFGAQSYRLGTAYFHTKPITHQILNKALASCRLVNMEER